MQHPVQAQLVKPLAPCDEFIGKIGLVADGFIEKQRRNHRHIGKREQQGTQKGKGHRLGHGPEHLALYTHERQDGQVHNQDDDDAKNRRAHDAAAGVKHAFVHFGLVKPARTRTVGQGVQVIERCFHDNHCAVDDEAKVNGSERHEVGGYPKQGHHADGKQHRQGDYRGDDESCPQVPYQQHQHQHHNQRTFDQVVLYGMDGSLNEFFPVEERGDGYPFRQGFFHLCQSRFYPANDLRRVFSFEHHDNTKHNLPLRVVAHGTIAERMAHPNVGHIGYQYRCTISIGHRDLADVVDRFGYAFRSDKIDVAVFFKVSAA